MQREKLIELAESCERATGPDSSMIDYAIARLRDENGKVLRQDPYTASLDAAMTLVPVGWRFAGSETMAGYFYTHLITRELDAGGAKAHAEAHADTLPLAICAAALRARALMAGKPVEMETV